MEITKGKIMKKLKKSLLMLLCASMILSVTACGGGGGADTTTAATTAATTTEDDDVVNPVDVSGVKLDFKGGENNIEPCELNYMGTYDMSTAGDIKPSVQYLSQNFNCTIKINLVAWAALEDSILTAIQGGTSPDLIDKQDNTYPHSMSKNMYTALDEYMDMSAPQWSGLEEYIDRYEWNGKHYYYPWSYDVNPYFMVYNRGLFEEKGIDDPYELYMDNNWTWDTFKQCMVDFVGDDTTKLGFYGYYASSFVNSAGTTMIDIDESGRLVNNIKSVEVERVQNFLMELRKQGLGNHKFGDLNNVDIPPVVKGDAAFQVMGGWVVTNYSKEMAKQNGFTKENPVIEQDRSNMALDIFFVPIPRDPEADKYYYSLSTFGYLIPSGSQHVEAACIFINCCRLSVTNSDLKSVTDASIIKNKRYTDEQYAFMQTFKAIENFKGQLIIDETFGFPTDVNELMKEMCSDVAFDQDEEQLTWTQMREKYYNIIQEQVDYYNAYITT